MRTLIQIQEEAATKLQVTRSSELRMAKYIGSVRRWYLAQVATHCGMVDGRNNAYSGSESWHDVREIVALRRMAEDAALADDTWRERAQAALED